MNQYLPISELTRKDQLPAGLGEELVRLITENTRVVFWLTDIDANQLLYISPSYEEIYGRSAASILDDPKSWLEAIHSEDRERIRSHMLRERKSRSFQELEYRIVKSDGEVRWLCDRSFPILDSDGSLSRVIGIVEDVTEKKLSEIALRQNEARLESLIGSIDEIVFELDAAGTFINVWTGNEDLLFIPRAELLGKKSADVFSEEFFRPFQAIFHRVLATGKCEDIEYPLDFPAGKTWFLGRVHRIPSADGSQKTVCMVVRDITNRKQIEEDLRASEEKFSKAFHSSPDAILIAGLSDGRLIDVNDNFVRVWGHTREEAIGKTTIELGMWLNAREREPFVALLKRDGEVRDLETRVAVSSGELRTVLISAHTLEIGGRNCLISIMRDITEKKMLEHQLRQAQKMEAVGRLAGGVAHDFNNLLVGILGYSELLKKKLPDDPTLHRMAGEINSAAMRARDLTSRLLALSRRQVMQPEVLDFNALVRQTERLLRPVLGEDIRIVLRLDKKTGSVKADPTQLEQVILNLALNARDAMPEGGTISLETSNIQVDAALAREQPGLIPGSYVRLWISDTGHGMSPEVLAQIFEPFFTTKEIGKGSGLGLSMVYGIVKQSGGCMTVSSEVGRGTAFAIYFPRSIEVTDLAKKSGAAPRPAGSLMGSETILLVEDEPVVRMLARDVLEGSGYLILSAPGGAEAIELSETTPETIHLLITDVVMPEMSGPQLASKLRKSRPLMRVLYMSGYTDDEVLGRKGLPDSSEFIQKPYTPDQFLRKVREAIDAGHRRKR